MKKLLIPLVLFLGLAVFLAIGLNRDPHEIPSPLIDKPAPAFSLKTLRQGDKSLSPQDLKGQVWMLNVWATWCTACKDEHPVLVQNAQRLAVPIIGLSYKEVPSSDVPANISVADKLDLARKRSEQWLSRHGNPYAETVFDLDGRVGIDYGVYGVPETYVIDKQGVIRYKRVGVVTPELIDSTLLPLIRKLQQS